MRVHITREDALVAEIDQRVGVGRRSAYVSAAVRTALDDETVRRQRRTGDAPHHHEVARRAAQEHHLGPGSRDGLPRRVHDRDGDPDLLLRPALPVAARLEREHQRSTRQYLPKRTDLSTVATEQSATTSNTASTTDPARPATTSIREVRDRPLRSPLETAKNLYRVIGARLGRTRPPRRGRPRRG